jgi:hypothetical protein
MYINKNKKPIYLFSIYLFLFIVIRMEVLDLLQSKKIRILYYVSPSHFYVYLQEKTNFHTHVNIRLFL